MSLAGGTAWLVDGRIAVTERPGRVDILRQRNRRLRTRLQASERACRRGARERLFEREGGRQAGAEIAAKGVAGADRVDRSYLQCRDGEEMVGSGGQHAVAAERHDDGAACLLSIVAHPRLPVVAGERQRLAIEVELGLVGDGVVGLAEKARRLGAERRGVEHADGTRRAGCIERRFDRGQRDLVLQKHDIALLQIRLRDVAGQYRIVSARHDGDHILAVGADQDERCAGGGEALADAGKIDTAGLQQRQRFGGKAVLADGADHAHLSACAGRGQRLVGAFAAGSGGKAGAADRLAGFRQTVDIGDQVEVDRAHDDDQERSPARAGEPSIEGRCRKSLHLRSCLRGG